MSSRHYDYIIAGAGLSGLSLAYRFINSPLASKKILIVDQNLTPENDKTWSFWHEGAPPFETLIHKSWKQVEVTFHQQSVVQQLQDYTYHSIKSRAFSEAILGELREHASVDLLEAPIEAMQGDEKAPVLQTNEHNYEASYIFQSCFAPLQLEKDNPHYPLIQHFLGWEIDTAENIFDPSTITLMDFDTGFEGGIAFVYILPETPKKALLEYTIFSENVEPKNLYEEKLRNYLHNTYNLRPLDFRTTRKEYGEIPMQDHIYVPRYAPRIINMGTVGGLTKPSTGYTFSRIQKHTSRIIQQLIDTGSPALPHRSSFRYRAYDLWLLQIIHDHPDLALEIFRQLFTNNSMDEVFRFLSESNSLLQDFKTMSKISYPPFFRAMWKTRKRLMEI